MSTTPAINKKKFDIGSFFHVLLRCCLVADYTPLVFFFLTFTFRYRQAVLVASFIQGFGSALI
jgi:hypothetical protein